MQLSEMINKVHCADCLQFMKDIPDKSIDLVLIDPPYNTTQLDFENDLFLSDKFLKELKRISKNGFMVCFSKQPFTSSVVMQKIFRYRYEIIWEKTHPTRFLDSGWRPLDNHENILIFFDEKSTYNPVMGTGNKYYKASSGSKTRIYGEYKKHTTVSNGERLPKSVLKYSNGNNNSFHPTEKNLDLMMNLVMQYSNENDLILDPFLGSGTTTKACQELHRNFIGIEISEKYCQIARERLKQHPLF